MTNQQLEELKVILEEGYIIHLPQENGIGAEYLVHEKHHIYLGNKSFTSDWIDKEGVEKHTIEISIGDQLSQKTPWFSQKNKDVEYPIYLEKKEELEEYFEALGKTFIFKKVI